MGFLEWITQYKRMFLSDSILYMLLLKGIKWKKQKKIDEPGRSKSSKIKTKEEMYHHDTLFLLGWCFLADTQTKSISI